MASKILSEIKTYKKSLILYVVVLIFFVKFFMHQKTFLILYRYFPEIPFFVFATLLLFTIWRKLYAKNNVVALSKKVFEFFLFIFIASVLYAIFSIFFIGVHLPKLQWGFLENLRHTSLSEMVMTPIVGYSVYFLFFQSIYMIFFLLIPGGGNNAKTVDIRPMFYAVVLIFAATVVEVFWVNFGDLYF